MTTNKTTAENLEARFDAGESVLDYFDLSRAYRPGHLVKRVNLDLAQNVLDEVDRVARRNAMTRQAILKSWIADRLKQEKAA